MKNKGDGKREDCKQWPLRGSCSRGAKFAFTHDGQNRGKGTGDKRQRTPSPTKRQPAPISEVSNQTGTRPSGKQSRPLCYSYKKGWCSKDKILRLRASSVLLFSRLSVRPDRRGCPVSQRHTKGFEYDRAKSSRRKLSAGSPSCEHP